MKIKEDFKSTESKLSQLGVDYVKDKYPNSADEDYILLMKYVVRRFLKLSPFVPDPEDVGLEIEFINFLIKEAPYVCALTEFIKTELTSTKSTIEA